MEEKDRQRQERTETETETESQTGKTETQQDTQEETARPTGRHRRRRRKQRVEEKDRQRQEHNRQIRKQTERERQARLRRSETQRAAEIGGIIEFRPCSVALSISTDNAAACIFSIGPCHPHTEPSPFSPAQHPAPAKHAPGRFPDSFCSTGGHNQITQA